ncbi:hypothetical protein B1209_19750 [Raoultella planticola]|nr:hypothetical protein B1209_19750 [Raoultella planticola]
MAAAALPGLRNCAYPTELRISSGRRQNGRPGKRSATGRIPDGPVVREIWGRCGEYYRGGGCRLTRPTGLCRARGRRQNGRPGKRSATGRIPDGPVVREILG